MRLGMLPSQKRALQRAFKKADKFDHFRSRTRRTFVGGGVAAIAAAATSFWVGMRTGRGEAKPVVVTSPRQQLARRIAASSDSDLMRDRFALLQGLEMTPNDPVAWGGFRRLARMATESQDGALAARLLLTLKMAQPSAEVDDLAEGIRLLAK